MKKIIFSGALLIAVLATAQQNTGINTTAPQATLDVTGVPGDTAKLDGIIAPRLTGAQLRAKSYTAAQTGAQVYVTAADTSPAGQTTNVTMPGYYFFDGSVWQRVLLNNLYTADGTLLSDRTVTMNNKNLNFVTSGNESIGIGVYYNTAAAGNSSIAMMGAFTASTGRMSVAIGSGSNTAGSSSLAMMGASTTGDGTNAIAIGGDGSGHFSRATGMASLAMLGAVTSSFGQRSVAIGIASPSIVSGTDGYNSLSLMGGQTHGNAPYSVAIGSNYGSTPSVTNGNSALAMMGGAAMSDNSIAIGNGTTSNDGVSIGVRGNQFTIASNGQVGIGFSDATKFSNSNTANPMLKVNGNIQTLGLYAAITSVSNDYSVQDGDYTIIIKGGTNFTLPGVGGNKGRVLILRNLTNNTLTISPYIRVSTANATPVTYQYSMEALQLQCDGTNWIQIN